MTVAFNTHNPSPHYSLKCQNFARQKLLGCKKCSCIFLLFCYCIVHFVNISAGADPGFQVRGGGALKRIAPSGGGAKIFGVFRVKNHDFTPKNLIFSNFRGGGRASGAPPSWICPWSVHVLLLLYSAHVTLLFLVWLLFNTNHGLCTLNMSHLSIILYMSLISFYHSMAINYVLFCLLWSDWSTKTATTKQNFRVELFFSFIRSHFSDIQKNKK